MMLLYSHPVCLVLGLVYGISVVSADLGPFLRSASYEQGSYGQWPQQSYHSSNITGPILNVQKYDAECNSGQYTLLSVMGSEVTREGPIILDEKGNLVWTSEYGDNWGLDVQMLDDRPYLTFCSWPGLGTNISCRMLDSEYQEAYAFKPQNKWGADATEFVITKDRTVLLTTSRRAPYDLTPMGGPRNGVIRDVGFQEIDIETGKLLFEWRYSDHWDVSDVVTFPSGIEGSPEKPWDPFHINSAQKDSAGNYLISARHTNTVGYINGRTGEFIWRLGGKRNSFKDLSGGAATNISMQHHARFLKENSTITLFDNGVISLDAPEHFQTRGLIIDIDVHAMTAEVRRTYLSPHKIGSKSRGSMQILDNNHVLLGYGVNAGWSEFSIDGNLLCDVHFAPETGFGTGEVISYRVLKRSWVGRPKTLPSIAHKDGNIYVSWNGATEVATWVLSAADVELDNYTAIASVPKAGFETCIPVPKDFSTSSLRVVALDSDGKILGRSTILDLADSIEQAAQGSLLVQK